MSDNKEKIIEMKKKSAKEALKFVREGMVIGVGSGSTVREFIRLLSESKLDIQSIICIPSSYDTEQLLIENSLHVGVLNQYSEIDLTVDGADRVDGNLNVIKGGGGAHLREKIIAAAAKEVIIIVDDSKIVDSLGGSYPVPVEVIPHAKEFVINKIRELGGKPTIRKASDKLGPTISDNGNIILDVDFQEIKNPDELEKSINNIPGVLENGIFPNRLITKVIIASTTEIKIKKK
ncbi:MAG TPA: ribose-5-phosphate isomerase RpiA [Candidatus Bathyarchaeia archaeon]|nr:ribose-5-phosphate isomerase RpiA [Candidatus Bathyarchaeia archaeon]